MTWETVSESTFTNGNMTDSMADTNEAPNMFHKREVGMSNATGYDA